MRKRCLTLVTSALLAGALVGQDWLQKPYTDWSPGQIDQVLNDSPWVGICVAEQKRGQLEALQSAGVLPSPLSWRFRLLTARPVREALLAEMALSDNAQASGAMIEVNKIKSGEPSMKRYDRLKEFIDTFPNDIRVKGDEENIIISLTLTQFVQSWVAAQYEIDRHALNGSERSATVVGEDIRRRPSDWHEDPYPGKLMKLQTSDLADKTVLSTKSGKKVAVLRYESPSNDMLGARFYFPRKLPDGSPLVTPADVELRFETVIGGKKVKVSFNLKKLVYKGKLEI